MATRFEDHMLEPVAEHSDGPDPGDAPVAAIRYCTEDQAFERNTGSTWELWAYGGASLEVTSISGNHNLDTLAMKNFAAAGDVTATVQPNATHDYAVGTTLVLFQSSPTGDVIVTPGAGVTLLSVNGLKSLGQGARIELTQLAINVWNVSGDLKT